MKYLPIFFMAFLLACTSEDVTTKVVVPGKGDVSFNFKLASQTINEGESVEVVLGFSQPTSTDGFVELAYTTTDATAGTNFTASPAFTNQKLKLTYPAGTDSLTFEVTALSDTDDRNHHVLFSITDQSALLTAGTTTTYNLTITDTSQPATSTDKLTVVTWNVEQFPKNGTTTINAIKDIVENMDADIIALQEMRDKSAFNDLVAAIDGWEGQLYDVRGSIELAYLYKPAEVTSFSNLTVLFPDDRDPFPRQPVVVTITHSSGLEVTLINIHLKCCDNGEARRKLASEMLKPYLDTNYPTQNVIVLGDYNDEILTGSPFTNFINDADNYLFADMEIAQNQSLGWSYPSWPSHIDHILISNELTDNMSKVETLKLDESVTGYEANVSDHRPITATFEN